MNYRLRSKITGFSMIEVLVSLLVLSIGLLGLARLQARLWSNATDLTSTSEALSLATAAAERFETGWSNRSATGTSLNEALAGNAETYDATLSVSEPSPEVRLRVDLQWDNQNGTHSMQLPSTILQPALNADVRWVLLRDYQVFPR